MNPTISIIIPAYRVEKYIGDCLNSILQQKGVSADALEILVIDDGSPDRSGEIAIELAKEFPFLKVIRKENAGVAAARNTGIEAATGQWLYFVDSDDWLAEGAIEAMLGAVKKHPAADILLFDAWQNEGDKETSWEHFRQERLFETREEILCLQRGVLYFPVCQPETKVPLAAPWDKLFKRSFLQAKNLRFREELKVLDDMIFSMEAFGEAGLVAYEKKKLYHYRYVPTSITNSYKPYRINKDRQVWEYIASYIEEREKQHLYSQEELEKLRQAFYCRVMKSFSICCRLCFFHKDNKKSFLEKLSFVRAVLRKEPYRSAFEKVDYSALEWRLKCVFLAGKTHLALPIYLLHLGQSLLG